ncbi:DUF3302 domain-containing protein [Microbulbifer thermotolerans]|uniref:Uncharacterized protein n=1 Tax=Microbulbifer thermotolerans TaxID=252514 RepID=A0A143HL72_MICTH|nr:DUF3302 domain-containing protein [Microbulbifer thermotolerans]AMX02464.1 hypothetical protein A3224_07590 [Microbulbifer thermotolerans]MCX2779315.1 DUF3302 domain-containing protein [Microbulbifer thermotolerans]MCX2784474.1 DUF3302 domain-containing protein [Microbulbifer thermotolerans]MCX2795066.1 DUF3302 domain-containing protein [Microbulbifer thermotolerans]MCX2806551.1 DUF3302 domain-containing protein [Microbulbifer thermotolerans]
MGFKLDHWDYLTFLVIIAAGISILLILLWIAGLPGKIALSRRHPDAEAVKIMGYAGFLAVVPWINAFIWAFKPTDTVDIRRFPEEEARAMEKEIGRLQGESRSPDKDGRDSDSDNSG